MSIFAGMDVRESLGGGLVSKIDAVQSDNFGGAFGNAAMDPSLETTDPIRTAEMNFKGLVVT